ncbi:MAG: hypothetical protein K9N55_03810 [Phycisphaerae bacterium]|nr:hypothetical protein [Phycisphaerae bacterium]
MIDSLWYKWAVAPVLAFFLVFVSTACSAEASSDKYGTITEETPSIAQYFSWINNTNEGATEAQTLINLRFFKWLHDEYGMRLGIYAFDAGAIDSQGYYGSMKTERFRKQFPNGWSEIAELARSFDCRLGLWGGPDGFGETAQEEAARTELLVSLCRDYGLQLFKFDAVCGQLRDEKQAAFVHAMTECRQVAPDLVVLNHRLNLDAESKRHVTTFLWGGQETYIDVHMANGGTATHHREGVLRRGLPPNLGRLTEDCGVCLSSCLDFWEDDLVLQGFNRSLILAPQIYGNPWLLRDDEFPKLARLFNLHFRYRQILVHGMVLPESYGRHAVARGDGETRFVTLRNDSWTPLTVKVQLDRDIGLTSVGPVSVRRFHPSEVILGTFEYGTSVDVTVDPFRSCLVMATVKPCDEVAVTGCTYEVVRDMPGKPVKIKLLGPPSLATTVKLQAGSRQFSQAKIAGRAAPELFQDGAVVQFPGTPADPQWHRKLGDLTPGPVPEDAEQLYEATCFAASNDALEVQSLERSGPSKIAQVIEARRAFFDQALFWRRGIWDKYLFDGREDTFMSVFHYRQDKRLSGGCLRVDLGQVRRAQTIRIKTLHDPDRDRGLQTEMAAEVAVSLDAWRPVVFKRIDPGRGQTVKVAVIENNGGRHELVDFDLHHWEAQVEDGQAFRYLRLAPAPDRTAEIEVLDRGAPVRFDVTPDATVLFAPCDKARPELAWETRVSIPGHPAPNSRLCVALNGEHGRDGAFVGLRLDGRWIGAAQRAVSFPAVVFEYGPATRSANDTYFFPVTPEMRGRSLDVVALGLAGCSPQLKPEVWITTYPNPYTSVELVLE